MFPDNDRFESKFTLGSDNGNVIEEKAFRLLALGDWSGTTEKKSFSERSFFEIDRDNFDSVFKRLRPKLKLNFSLKDDESLDLEFSELDDFHPDNIFRNVGLFKELRNLRRRLTESSTFNSAAREVRNLFFGETSETLNETSTETKTIKSEELLDQILSGKSENVKLQVTHSTELSVLLKDLVRPYLINFDENEQKSLLTIVDNATGDLMRNILHHPKFQELESAWRSLYYLVRNTETNSTLKIYILDVSKNELSDKLKESDNLADTAIFQKIVVETKASFDDEDWSLLIGNYEFGLEIDDVAALIRISKIASTIQSPFISKVSPQLFGVDSLDDNFNLNDLKISEDSAQEKLWSTLRSLPASQYLGLTFNGFLLRLPYGAGTLEIDSFAFEEINDKPSNFNYLWGNSAFICALLLARSFSKYEWQMSRHLEQDIENLPVHIYSESSETFFKSCAEITLTQTDCERLLKLGLMPLISYKNTDLVKLARFQSITKPVSSLSAKWNFR